MADAQILRTRGSQSMQKDSHSGARAAPGPQRKPLLPRVQMHVWCLAARLCAAPAHRGSPGTDADDVRAPQLDCGQVRHVRSAALHALFPSHSRRDAAHVASHSARRAEGFPAEVSDLGETRSDMVAKEQATESAETDHAREYQRNEGPRAARTVFADVGVHGSELYARTARPAGGESHI